MLILSLSLFTLVVFLYAVYGRQWLITQPWAQGFFTWIEPFERRVFLKSETILAARLKMFVGAALTFLTQTQQIDITLLMPLVPDAWEPTLLFAWNLMPLALTILGFADEKLRKDTNKPLDVVSLSPVEAAKPEVAAAVAQVEVNVAVAKAIIKTEADTPK